MEALLTPEEVAGLLKISTRTVYENGKRLGGFYPAGIKVLRFREGVIREFMEGQGKRNVEIQIPDQWKGLRGGRTQDEEGSQGCQGGKKEATPGRAVLSGDKDPNRHGLFGSRKSLPGRKSEKARTQNL